MSNKLLFSVSSFQVQSYSHLQVYLALIKHVDLIKRLVFDSAPRELLTCVQLSPNLLASAPALQYFTPRTISSQVVHSHRIWRLLAKSLLLLFIVLSLLALSNSGAVQLPLHHHQKNSDLLSDFWQQTGLYSSARRCGHELGLMVNDWSARSERRP